MFKKFLVLAAAAVCLAAGPAPAKDLVERAANGAINWSAGFVLGQGMGVAQGQGGQDRYAARRAAVVDCQRNLLETVEGVRLTSTTVVRDAVLVKDEIRTTVTGIVRGAQVVSEGFDAGQGLYKVTMQMPLAGRLLGAVLTKEMLVSDRGRDGIRVGHLFDLLKKVGPWTDLFVSQAWASEFTPSERATLEKILKILRESGPDKGLKRLEEALAGLDQGSGTGLIVDARGVAGFKAAACPWLRAADGRNLYPGGFVNLDQAKLTRPVSYDLDVKDAIANKRVTNNPITVKAVGVYKQRVSDLVLPEADAVAVLKLGQTGEVLQKCRVIIVVAE